MGNLPWSERSYVGGSKSWEDGVARRVQNSHSASNGNLVQITMGAVAYRKKVHAVLTMLRDSLVCDRIRCLRDYWHATAKILGAVPISISAVAQVRLSSYTQIIDAARLSTKSFWARVAV